MRNNKKSLIILAVVFMAAAAAGWVVIRQLRQASLTKGEAAYDTYTVRRMDLSDKIDVTGDVVTEKNAAIYPPYSATVKEILVKPGDSVNKGELLLKLQLKDTDLINYTPTWKSSLEQARANLATAQKALEREQILYRVQGATIDDVEAEQIKVRQYQAQIVEYRQKLLSLTKNGIDNNGDVLITAPFDAEVSWINVKLEEAVTNATELLTLGGNRAIRIKASVDQGDINQIRIGLPVTIKANDQNRTIISGSVTSFGSTGTINSNVVTFPVVIQPMEAQTAALPDQENRKAPAFKKAAGRRNAGLPRAGLPDAGLPGAGLPGAGRPKFGPPRAGSPAPPPAGTQMGKSAVRNSLSLLKPGMTVDVSIMTDSHANILAVPLAAVAEQNGQSSVKLLEHGKLVSKAVRLGYQSILYAEVLAGLAEGDQVAVPVTEANHPASQNGSGARRGGMMRVRMGPGGGG